VKLPRFGAVFGYLGYPLVLAGGAAVFALSSVGALGMVAANAHRFTSPVAVRSDFNLPPVTQIGSIDPPRVEFSLRKKPESSIIALAPPETAVAVAVAPPEQSSFPALVEPGGLYDGRIGSQAVNVRAGASNDAARLGVLDAGATVRLGENRGGWIHVYYDGGDGWVYSRYIETLSTASMTTIR
jgi:hypothetical protein